MRLVLILGSGWAAGRRRGGERDFVLGSGRVAGSWWRTWLVMVLGCWGRGGERGL